MKIFQKEFARGALAILLFGLGQTSYGAISDECFLLGNCQKSIGAQKNISSADAECSRQHQWNRSHLDQPSNKLYVLSPECKIQI